MKDSLSKVMIAAAVGFTAMTVAAAQNALPSFEVASIKPNTSARKGWGLNSFPVAGSQRQAPHRGPSS